MANNIHVTHRKDDNWQVKRENTTRASVVTRTQKEAIDIGRSISKNNKCELFIHGRDNRIRERDTHGHDPYPPKG